MLTKDKTYYRTLIALSLPIALQNLITFSVTFADNIMVNTLGDSAVAGVFVGSQIQTLLQMFTSGCGSALAILGAMYWGKGDHASIKQLIGIGFRISIYVGLAITVVCLFIPASIVSLFTNDVSVIAEGTVYLKYVCLSFVFFCMSQIFLAAARCIEAPKVGMYVSAISLVFNIVFNYLFIFGKLGFPKMGVMGAAIATVISRFVEAVCAFLYLTFRDRKLGFLPKDLCSGTGILRKDYIKYGLPLISGEVVWAVNMLCNSSILGHYGKAVTTAASVTNTMNTLFYVAILGLSTANGIIASKTVGAERYDKMKEYARTAQLLFLALGLVVGGTMYLINKPFVSLYRGISAEAAQQSVQFIHVLCVTIIGTCYQMPCLFMVKSGGDINFVFINDTIFVFLVVLPSAILASYLNAPAWIVFACLKCDQVLKCIVAVFKVNSFNWMKDLSRNKSAL